MRDNALASALLKLGHDVILLPLYTPTRTDEANVSQTRVFFGGISVFLQQKFGLFRWTPKLMDWLWDLPGVIKAFAGRGVAVDPASLGALTVSMLEGRDGRQRKEVDNLVEWLRTEPVPDVITLPYSLLIALARPLKEATGRPVICGLQGEELFLEGLQEPWRSRALALIRSKVRDVDAFIAVSEYEAGFMAEYLGIRRSVIHVVPLGISLEGHAAAPKPDSGVFRVGYLGRIAPEKGLHVLAEAYKLLKKTPGMGPCRLDAAGYMAPEFRGYLAEIERGLAGLDFEYHGEVDREGKVRFLQQAHVFSMPCTYAEPKGLPLLEAMANGTPVVQPRHGSFPEMLEATGGGLLVGEASAEALADGLLRLARDRRLAAELGARGAAAVRERYSIERAARDTIEIYERVAGLEAAPLAVV